MKNPPEGGNSF